MCVCDQRRKIRMLGVLLDMRMTDSVWRSLFFLGSLVFLCEARAKSKDDFVRVNVPSWVRESDTALLHCHYDVDVDKLYSLKWYKGAQEFFRYTPKEIPPFKTFPPFGSHVNLQASNSSVVALDAIVLNMTDKYTCEVTKDFPDYTTSFRSANLHVFLPPKGQPVISPVFTSTKIGEMLAVNCTSRPSQPAANLRWLLNGLVVSPQYLGTENIYKDANAKETVTLGLNFTVRQQDFVKDRITLSCRSILEPNLYESWANISVINKLLHNEGVPEKHLPTQTDNHMSRDTSNTSYCCLSGAGVIWTVFLTSFLFIKP